MYEQRWLCSCCCFLLLLAVAAAAACRRSVGGSVCSLVRPFSLALCLFFCFLLPVFAAVLGATRGKLQLAPLLARCLFQPRYATAVVHNSSKCQKHRGPPCLSGGGWGGVGLLAGVFSAVGCWWVSVTFRVTVGFMSVFRRRFVGLIVSRFCIAGPSFFVCLCLTLAGVVRLHLHPERVWSFFFIFAW